MHLSELRGRQAWEFSGGQAQRVALARALAARPRVLLLDKPFSALDAPLVDELHDLVRKVREALDPTIMLVTHDHAATAFADEVAVLSAGRLVQHDPVDRLCTRPAYLVIARQMGGRNELLGTVRGHHHDSVLGSLRLPVGVRPPPGLGVLVFRHETVQVTDPDDTTADAVGAVTEVRPCSHAGSSPSRSPIHRRLTRATSPSTPRRRRGVGDQVGLRLSPHAFSLVPPDPAEATPHVEVTSFLPGTWGR